MSSSQLKRYKKIKYLGKGSHGAAILVEARDSSAQPHREGQPRLLVMKEIIIGHLSEQEQRAAKMEAELLRQMSHENIVMCIESFVESSKLYIIMEYADGGDIGAAVQKMISTHTIFTEHQILHIFSQIAFAMKYVHDSNILHRDLKSQNIFLMSDGTVKLGDFGIAKVLDKTDDQAQTQIGTPYYLSPELCESSPYGRPSDIWALGIVLYEMMALELPFQARSIPALIHKICTLEPSFATAEAVYSPELVSLARVILQKDPNKRPTIKEIARSDILKDFGNTVLKGSIFKKVPTSSHICDSNDIGNNSSSSRSGTSRSINVAELESALPLPSGFNDMKSPKDNGRRSNNSNNSNSNNSNSDDDALERNEKLEKLKQFRLQIGRNNKLTDNSDNSSVAVNHNSSNNVVRKVEKNEPERNNGILNDFPASRPVPMRHVRAASDLSSPQRRPQSLAEMQAERRIASGDSPSPCYKYNNGGFSNNINNNQGVVVARSPSSILYPQGSDYESVIKRNFFANRATALAVKAKVEAMERGEASTSSSSSSSCNNKDRHINNGINSNNRSNIHSHRDISIPDSRRDDYYSAESRIASIRAHKERERLRQLEERDRQIQKEHEINRSSRRSMKDIKGIAFEINLGLS